MKIYKYIGPQTHCSTIRLVVDGIPKLQDLILAPGEVRELPDEHPMVLSMLAMGLLQETEKSYSPQKTAK